MTKNQIDLINNLAQEIGWWKQGLVTQKMIEEFVRHELNGLHPEQENQLINGLSYLLNTIKNLE